MGRIVQQQNLSLNMSLLLFTLLSTALAVPTPCPPLPPMDCGEGMTNCPGPVDPMGCMMPESCVAEGDACPFHCPPMPPMECGEGMINCPGPVDPMGCMILTPAWLRETLAHSTAPICHPLTAERVCGTAPVPSTQWAAYVRFLRCGGRRVPLPLPPYATHGL